MTPATSPADGYAFGRTHDERERLVTQAKLIDRITERYLREAGVAPGMRVLDLGSGMGDVALIAAQIVGPEGRVVGVERDAETVVAARARIEALGVADVEIVEGDVAALDGVGGAEPFDAAIGRLLLIHVADPIAVLRGAAEVDPDTLADRLRADVVATGGVAASPPLIGAWARLR